MNRALQSSLILVLVSAFSAAAWAGVHPVPLDPKADSAVCAQCHEDKTKAKSVHTAIAMGCTSCHEIRVKKDVTRTKLIKTTTVALCISCHADKKAADIKGKVHPPADSRLCEVPRSAHVRQ